MKLSKIAVKPWKSVRSRYSHSECFLTGFTLIELIVALVLVSIFATIVIPNYLAMQERGRQAMVLENMRIVQLAAEAYGVDFGAYPRDLLTPGQGFGYYFPGGDQDGQARLGEFPRNPYTTVPMRPQDFFFVEYLGEYDNSNRQIGGYNDVQLGSAGAIRYGIYCAGLLAKHYGIVGARKDRLTLRSSVIWVIYD